MPARGPDYVLSAVRNFVSTLWWAPETYIDALTLVLAVTHVKDSFTTVPYVLMTSDKPKTGKSTGSTDIPALLASNFWVIDRMVTTDALRNKFTDRTPPDTYGLDDASKSFGESGTNGKTSLVYQMMINSYRRGAKTSVSRNGTTLDLPTYGTAFMNGLRNAVPEDLATRAIQFKLSPKPSAISMRDALSPAVAKEAEPLKLALHRWAVSQRKTLRQFMLSDVNYVHPLLTDRTRQLWGPLFALAHAAGGTWPARCMTAFQEMALDESDRPAVLLEDQVLLDTASVALKHDVPLLFTADLLAQLRVTAGDSYDDIDDDSMVDLLDRALGESAAMRGRTLDGRMVVGRGRAVAPVLKAAAELHDELNPQAAAARPTRAQQELALTEVGR